MEDNGKENVDQGFSAVSVAKTEGSGGGGGGGNGGCAREDDEVLKRRISCHPLYGLLTETHLDCLKASMGDIEGLPRNSQNQANDKINTSMPSCSELDHFMEMYCVALSDLKEAIKEPVQETTAFIDAMYFQLMELTGMGTHPPHTPPTSPGKREE
ncbi:homeobox protein knotted-1-like 12 isoform X2 [Macadamia integrifolia]|uniref:homeobox protein knotted-1-like 12 isoform X2 n=1 Tax=Macadamia integrifolia TaxID=60698 RepID=UPI001C533506|nr:homeobox protein knotted-1-like 12 isoform X2 [Macadamia integrifolia]